MRDFLDDRPIKLRRDRPATTASGRLMLVIVGLCLLSGLLILLDRQGWMGVVRTGLQQALVPVARLGTNLRDSAASMTALLGDSSLRARINQLELENSRLNEELLRYQQAQVENLFLRQQLAIEQTHPWKLLGAEVIVRAPDAGRRVMLLARGARDGLSSGMAVIGQSPGSPAALVGIIESVNHATAEVLLLTDVSSQISGRVLHGEETSVGLVQGQWQLGSRMRLLQIDRTMPLAPGDPVLTAGLTAALGLPLNLAAVPSNIPIGTIEQIETIEQYQQAELRPFVDPDQVRYVWVILSQDD